MQAPVLLRPVRLPLAGLAALRDAAAREGFAFLDRLAAEWESGANRFERPGAELVGAFADDRLVGIGGLNRDPYCRDPATGRLRHVYVLPAWRGRGVGSALVGHLLATAHGRFERVRLRTDTPDAGTFYRRRGFLPTAEPDATHALPIIGSV